MCAIRYQTLSPRLDLLERRLLLDATSLITTAGATASYWDANASAANFEDSSYQNGVLLGDWFADSRPTYRFALPNPSITPGSRQLESFTVKVYGKGNWGPTADLLIGGQNVGSLSESEEYNSYPFSGLSARSLLTPSGDGVTWFLDVTIDATDDSDWYDVRDVSVSYTYSGLSADQLARLDQVIQGKQAIQEFYDYHMDFWHGAGPVLGEVSRGMQATLAKEVVATMVGGSIPGAWGEAIAGLAGRVFDTYVLPRLPGMKSYSGLSGVLGTFTWWANVAPYAFSSGYTPDSAMTTAISHLGTLGESYTSALSDGVISPSEIPSINSQISQAASSIELMWGSYGFGPLLNKMNTEYLNLPEDTWLTHYRSAAGQATLAYVDSLASLIYWDFQLGSGGSGTRDPSRSYLIDYVSVLRAQEIALPNPWHHLTDSTMCHDMQPNDPWGPIGAGTTFYQADEKVMWWGRFEGRGQNLTVKDTWYRPDGYSWGGTFTIPLASYDWYAYGRWISIDGYAAEQYCGPWRVEMSMVNPSTGQWQVFSSKSFTILESPNVPPMIDVSRASGDTLTVSISDNTLLDEVYVGWNDGSQHSANWSDLYSKTKSYSFTTPAGIVTQYSVYAKDTSGNVAQVSGAIDRVAPIGNISMASAHEYDNDINTLDGPVSIMPYASDNYSGIGQMRWCFGGTDWGEWVPYAATAFHVDVPDDVIAAAVAFDRRVSVSIQYKDLDGNTSGTCTASLALRSPQTFTVTSLADTIANDGVITLREALQAANMNAPLNTVPAGSPFEIDAIIFALTLFASGPGILLMSGDEFVVSDSVTIVGPGIGSLTVDARGASRAFAVSAPTTSLEGLTITGGNGWDGGGIHFAGSSLSLSRVAIIRNSASGRGGGMLIEGGVVSITDSFLLGNVAQGQFWSGGDGGGSWEFGEGGAVYVSAGRLVAANLVVVGNVAGSPWPYYTPEPRSWGWGWGGGVYAAGGEAIITNATFCSNLDRQGGCGTSGYAAVNNSIAGPGGAIDDQAGSSNAFGDCSFGRLPSSGMDSIWGTSDDDYGDLHLRADSPAIDAGANALAVGPDGYLIPFDVSGRPRIANDTVDCGAYEFQYVNCVGPVMEMFEANQAPLDEPLVFSELQVGRTACEYVLHLRNTGDVSLRISLAAVGGLDSDQFLYLFRDEYDLPLTGSDISIAPGSCYTMEVSFAPVAPLGLKQASLSFDTNSPGIPHVSLALLGTASAETDVAPPVGELSLFSAREYDGDTATLDCWDLNLLPLAYDAGSSVSWMRWSIADGPPSDWVSYSEQAYAIAIPPEVISSALCSDRLVVVGIQYKDAANNVSDAVSASILLRAPQTYVVTSLVDTIADDGVTTLRECLEASNTSGPVNAVPAGSPFEPDMVTFSPLLFNSGQATLALAGGQLVISDAVSIIGPGPGLLSIDAHRHSRVIMVVQTSLSMQGVTLTGGSAGEGGGIYAGAATMQLDDIVLRHNQATVNGGGVWACGGTLEFNLVTLSHNVAGSAGGAIYTAGCALSAGETTIVSNTANDGGGVYVSDGSSLNLSYVTIAGNSATECGGGISIVQGIGWGISHLLSQVVMRGNHAVTGGAMFITGHQTIEDAWCHLDVTCTRCSIQGNVADSCGGGVYAEGYDMEVDVAIVNSVIIGNRAANAGAMFTFSCYLDLANCTVVSNLSADGPAIWAEWYWPLSTVNNTILIQNQQDSGFEFGGTHNLMGIDPLFVRNPSPGNDGAWGTNDDDYGDLRLMAGSLGIDTGDNSLSEEADEDIAGKLRIVNGTVDIGAYEFQGRDLDAHVVDRRILYNNSSLDTADKSSVTTIPAAPAVPLIDGMDDPAWAKVTCHAFERVVYGSVASRDDSSGTWRAIWDMSSVYFMIDVKDDIVVSDSAIEWDDDVVEIYLDPDNSRQAVYDQVNDTQYLLRWNDSRVYVSPVSPQGNVIGVECAMVRTATGYSAEVAIPWAALGITPSEGMLMGVEVAVLDDDHGGGIDSKVQWFGPSNRACDDPTTFAAAILGRMPAESVPNDDAIALDKCSLLPGETASGENLTSFSRGLNGIIVDIQGLVGVPAASEFLFRAGSAGDPSGWAVGPAPQDISLRPGAGVDGSDRVTIAWGNGVLRAKWLQVTVLSDAHGGHGGLAQDHVFYFGNLPGDFNCDGIVKVGDLGILASNWGSSGATPSRGDATMDGVVNVGDLGVLASNWGGQLPMVTVPGVPAGGSAQQAGAEGLLLSQVLMLQAQPKGAVPASRPNAPTSLPYNRINLPLFRMLDRRDALTASAGAHQAQARTLSALYRQPGLMPRWWPVEDTAIDGLLDALAPV